MACGDCGDRFRAEAANDFDADNADNGKQQVSKDGRPSQFPDFKLDFGWRGCACFAFLGRLRSGHVGNPIVQRKCR